jgi:hypothetical protein
VKHLKEHKKVRDDEIGILTRANLKLTEDNKITTARNIVATLKVLRRKKKAGMMTTKVRKSLTPHDEELDSSKVFNMFKNLEKKDEEIGILTRANLKLAEDNKFVKSLI